MRVTSRPGRHEIKVSLFGRQSVNAGLTPDEDGNSRVMKGTMPIS